jgi:predicted metalloprotease with PDZ domain
MAFCLAPVARAEFQATQIMVQVSRPDLVKITIRPRQPLRNWTFINSYAEALGLGDRVQGFQSGSAIVVKRIATGVFEADSPLTSVTYEVRLAIDRVSNPAHVSWLTADGGVLMLADLLPIEVAEAGRINARFELPDGWRLPSFVTARDGSDYLIADPQNAVLSIGPDLKTTSKKFSGMQLDVVVSGYWSFSAAKVTDAAAQILKKYLELTEFQLPNARVLIARAPKRGLDTWQAQARGSTLLLLIDPQADFKNWIGQLKVIFTHELFHLWVPNALKLKGDYDWFFEGFTLYQALITALELKVISFDEYLNTLARAYDSYVSKPDRLSLLEASEQRWTGATSAVYDKGMLVAFLYDLKRRSESQGASRLSDLYSELFRKYATKTVDGNEAIMSLLISSTAAGEVFKSYVEERRPLELKETLSQYGLVLQTNVRLTDLKIAKNLTRDQVRLLRSLGYRR